MGKYVRHEDRPEVDLRHVELATALRPVAERKDETSHQDRQIQPFEDDTESQSSRAE